MVLSRSFDAWWRFAHHWPVCARQQCGWVGEKHRILYLGTNTNIVFGKNIHFPARGSASEALAAFIKKIAWTLYGHGVWIKWTFEQLDRISNVVACLPQAGLPPTPKPTGCVLNCSTVHKYPTLKLYCTITLASTTIISKRKLRQPLHGLSSNTAIFQTLSM